MNGKIQILDGKKDSYTAKEAMQHAVEYMQTDEVRAIQVITFVQDKDSESEAELFIKMFGRFLHKNSKKVFLFAETEALLSKMLSFLPEKYTGIQIVETAALDEQGISDDMILNRINGVEVDCIMAALSDSMQESFISRYRTSLDAKIWVGFGTHLRMKKKRWDFHTVKEFLIRHMGKADKK